MNRRDVLKALGALPIASALGGCGHASPAPAQGPYSKTRIHTLQVLIEGAFAVVLQKQIHRVTAFVPLPDPANKELAHHFCFNDPANPRRTEENSKGYNFKLAGEGLHTFEGREPEPYVNPGFSDFSAETQVWHLPRSLVVLDLPFPRSINFSGRPLHVRFGKRGLKPTGLMPTNFILEYRVDDESKVQLKCEHSEMQCSPSPNCPPGILRYYFGVGPEMKDVAGRQKHAIAFFNFLLASSFPELKEKYELVEIEASDYEPEGSGGTARPASFEGAAEGRPFMAPAVLRGGAPRARLLPVASLVDCQSGGILITTKKGPTG
jgi:hypothetical protein